MLEGTGRVAEERGRPAPAEHARAAFVALWDAVDWSEPSAWNGNENYGAALFWTASHRTSPEHVREHLARALASRPDVVLRLVTGCAGWEETRDSQDWGLRGFRRTYSELPPWFPAEAVAAAAAVTAPHVAPAPSGLDGGDDPESLLAQALRLARFAAS